MIHLTRRNASCTELTLGALRLFFVNEHLVLIRTPTAAVAHRGSYDATQQTWWLSERTIRHLQRLIDEAPITVADDLEAVLADACVHGVPGPGSVARGRGVRRTAAAFHRPVLSGAGIGGGTFVPRPDEGTRPAAILAPVVFDDLDFADDTPRSTVPTLGAPETGIAAVLATARQQGVVVLDYEDAGTIAVRVEELLGRAPTADEVARITTQLRDATDVLPTVAETEEGALALRRALRRALDAEALSPDAAG